MNRPLVEQIADAVLYEGYLLYPYREAVKNRQRWTFGGLYPHSYSLAQRGGSDGWSMRTECLVLGTARTRLEVRVRFLHLRVRQVGQLDHQLAAWPSAGEPRFRLVEMLQVGETRYQTWQEAVERTVTPGEASLGELAARPRSHAFSFPAGRELEPLRDPAGGIAGVLVRTREAIAGSIELSSEEVEPGLFQVAVEIGNRTPFEDAERKTRDEALMRALVSTHTILGVREGEFVSLLDPPERWREVAARCRNHGTWPVLVGDQEAGEMDTMLSAPIILYDYPRLAPESPGDLFDSTEIDEILTLRILTLTDAEKQEAAALDERVRALLDRTAALDDQSLARLHGAVRSLRTLRREGD
jgi:hydrogenase maturation protease